MRLVLLAALWFSIVQAYPAAAGAALTPMEFRDAFAAALTKRYPQAVATPISETMLEVHTGKGAHGRLNLAQPYQEYLSNPADRDAVVDRYTGMMEVALSDQPLVAKANLSVVIARADMAKSVATGSSDWITRDLAGDLTAYLVLRLEKTSKFATAADLQTLAISADQAWEQAAQNEMRRAPLTKGRLSTSSQPDAVLGDNAFARLFLDPTTCREAATTKGHAQVFLMLAPGAYAVGYAEQGDSMARFWRQAAEVARNSTAVSRTPLTCEGGHWAVATSPR